MLDNMTAEECAIEAANLAQEINMRQERLELLKTALRSHAAIALMDMTGQPYGSWAPALHGPYSGTVLVTAPAPVVSVLKGLGPSRVRDVVGEDAYGKYFTARVVVTVLPIEDFRAKVVQEADPALRDRLLSVVEITNPTARVSLRPRRE